MKKVCILIAITALFCVSLQARMSVQRISFNTYINNGAKDIDKLYTGSKRVSLVKNKGKVISKRDLYKISPAKSGRKSSSFKANKVAMLQASIPSLMYVEPSLETNDANNNPELIGIPLAYPNPFSLNKNIGRAKDKDGNLYVGTRIGYELSIDMDMRLIVYDMLGHKVYEQYFEAGQEPGGAAGWNEVPFDRDCVGGFDLPSGIYFFLLIYEGDVLGRGKMAVIP
jgi:hypothetical protein